MKSIVVRTLIASFFLSFLSFGGTSLSQAAVARYAFTDEEENNRYYSRGGRRVDPFLKFDGYKVESLRKRKNGGSGTPAPIPPPVSSPAYPNDPYFGSSGSWGQSYADLWGIHKIGLSSAVWNLYKGEGIKIAVVDTGVLFDHEDLSSNIWRNDSEFFGLPGVDDDNNGFIDDVRGWDFVDWDNSPLDLNGHGTHVAGIAAASGNNSKGIIGVAPLAKIIPVRVLDRFGSGTIDWVAQGIRYAAKVGAQIINLSLGAANLDWYNFNVLQQAVDYARGLGRIVVAAAGNSNSNVDAFSPANLNGVIAVGATDASDSRAYFSNYGSKLFITAPGVDILSLGTAQTHIGTAASSNYYRASGTSMAAPFVSGAIALLLNKYPTASLDQIKTFLATGAVDLGASGKDFYYGNGRLNIAASLGLTTTSSTITSTTTVSVNTTTSSTASAPANKPRKKGRGSSFTKALKHVENFVSEFFSGDDVSDDVTSEDIRRAKAGARFHGRMSYQEKRDSYRNPF
jgi:subtilisin family serine protease